MKRKNIHTKKAHVTVQSFNVFYFFFPLLFYFKTSIVVLSTLISPSKSSDEGLLNQNVLTLTFLYNNSSLLDYSVFLLSSFNKNI